MKSTAKKVSKTSSIDEDILFLSLKLIDFPQKKKRSFGFQYLGGQCPDSSYARIVRWIFEIQRRHKGVRIRNLKFNYDTLKEIPETILLVFDDYLKRGNKSLSNACGYSNWIDILCNEFSIEDLRVIAYASSPIRHLQDIFSCLNFRIDVEESCQTSLSRFLEKNTENFIADLLASNDENVCTFAHHKRVGFKIIREIVEKCGRDVLLKKLDFGSHIRFADFVVALHSLRYLEVVEMPYIEETGFAFKVRIKEKLLDEDKRQGKNNHAKKEIQPLDILPKTNWEDIEIRFINGDDIRVLAHGKFIKTVSSAGLGCSNSKNGSPDKQWKLLQNLSISEGKFDINRFGNIKEKEKFKQQRGKLSQRLKKLLGIEDDPIPFDEVRKIYATRFKVLPEGDLRRDGELFGLADDLL